MLYHQTNVLLYSYNQTKHLSDDMMMMNILIILVGRASPAPRTSDGFLPRIEASPSRANSTIPSSYECRALQHVDPSRPVTLELSHGGERQVIALPTERLDRTKRYYVTFTIKPGDGQTTMETTETTKNTDQHQHAKSL
jgi:hypothetical protein